MCLYAYDNFQVCKDYTKRSSRNVFNLLNAMPFFEAVTMNVNVTFAASFSCIFATKPTSFLYHKGTVKIVYSVKVNFIFDPAFDW